MREGGYLDETLRKEIIREDLKRKNKGKKIVPAKYRMKYPDSAEREYVRLANEYMAIEKEVLLKYIPELKQILNEGTKYNTDSKKDNEKKRKVARFSTIDNTIVRLGILFDSIQKELDSAFGLYDLKRNLNKIANLDHKLTIAEWKKTVSKTLGINILDDYYSGEYYQRMLEQWVSANVDLIKTVPKDSLGSLKEKVYSDYMNGRSTTNIVKELQRQYGMDKRHAQLIARDQTAKLNSNITQSQQRDAGVNKYKWSTVGDGRVRDSHDALDGEIFSWDDPPETDDGRRCHPGEDYQCRCCAIPVFDIDELDLPV
jgi:SPP1 gp7 family putative phage head morphogenesis protein